MAASAVPPRPARLLSPVLAAAVLVMVIGAGCGRDADESPTGSPGRPGATGSPAVDEVDAPNGSGYPATVQEYAEAAVAAWAAPDLIRLAELAAPTVHEQIIDIPGPPNLRWSFVECEAADETAEQARSDCSFHNTDGDQLVLTVAHPLLTEAQAVVDVGFDSTVYPEDPADYVAEFVEAWRTGNQPRMNRLALAGAAAEFQQLPPPPEVTYQVGEAEDRVVTVLVVLADPEPPAEVEVQTRLSTALLGEPQAIRQATVAQP